MSNIHFTAFTNETKLTTKTNYGKKLINTSQKFVKAFRWKYRIGWLQQFLRKSEPNPAHTKFEKSPPTPTQPMDGLGKRPTGFNSQLQLSTSLIPGLGRARPPNAF